MKAYLKGKSKILFATAILSTILFIICIPTVLEYSRFVAFTTTVTQGDFTTRLVHCVLGGQMFFQFTFVILILIMIAALFNIAGFLYGRHEFNFMAIGLFLMVSCMGCYVFSSCGTTLLLLLVILSIIGYVDQYKNSIILKK